MTWEFEWRDDIEGRLHRMAEERRPMRILTPEEQEQAKKLYPEPRT